MSFYSDTLGRDAATLIDAWPTLRGVPAGVARAGVDVTIVQAAARRETLECGGATFHFIDDDRAAPLRLGGGIAIPRRPRRLLDFVASLEPDVVHLNGFIYPLAVWQLARKLRGVPLLIQDHASRVPRGLRRQAWRAACRPLAGVAFTSREQALPFFESRVFRPELPVFEVMEGSSLFAPGDLEAARERTGIHGDPCFLWTGHLVPGKDPLTAIDAFRLAAQKLPGARLWCCFGKASLREVVSRRIADDPMLHGRVRLLGWQPYSEMEHFYRAADFFVQASLSEGSGYSIIEALSCGTTPLVTDIPGMRRVVGGAGSLTPVGDPQALADAMVLWAARDRAALRRDARAWFESALSFDVIGRELRAVYETLAHGA